jgi:hypothetical protein
MDNCWTAPGLARSQRPRIVRATVAQEVIPFTFSGDRPEMTRGISGPDGTNLGCKNNVGGPTQTFKVTRPHYIYNQNQPQTGPAGRR